MLHLLCGIIFSRTDGFISTALANLPHSFHRRIYPHGQKVDSSSIACSICRFACSESSASLMQPAALDAVSEVLLVMYSISSSPALSGRQRISSYKCFLMRSALALAFSEILFIPQLRHNHFITCFSAVLMMSPTSCTPSSPTPRSRNFLTDGIVAHQDIRRIFGNFVIILQMENVHISLIFRQIFAGSISEQIIHAVSNSAGVLRSCIPQTSLPPYSVPRNPSGNQTCSTMYLKLYPVSLNRRERRTVSI